MTSKLSSQGLQIERTDSPPGSYPVGVSSMAEAAPTDVTIKSAKAANFWPVFVVGLTCAYDYAATIINIQQYFGLIGGVCVRE